ncbi:MAG: efflux RND transporter periplasmic adaptor subunit [Gammaproteobacteria bacterium]|nr:efflux RND transporter periplasmic adaptor subunit [Gammaproteobacteria bacterium]
MKRLLNGSLLIALALMLGACDNPSASYNHDERGHDDHGHDDHTHVEPSRGPHGGRLLSQNSFTLELSIFDTGVEPHFRAYPTLDGKSIPPDQVELRVELRRINGLSGGRVDQHLFSAEGPYLRGASIVEEPHSYQAVVRARHQNQNYEWIFDSPEAQVEIASTMAAANQIAFGQAGPGTIRETLTLTGRIEPNAERTRLVRARFPGTVRSVAVQVGDVVSAGQTLATVESDDSLQTYAVTAPIGGTVIKRSTNPGESSGTAALFEIIDLKSLWANLAAFPSDRAQLRPGQSVYLRAADGTATARGKVALIASSITGPAASVRVVIDNRDANWTPGQFVNAEITIDESPAALTVPIASLQTMGTAEVVFLIDGERYQAQPISTGRRDSERVEVLRGLANGARIVTRNSFLIKADIEKSGAAHEH